MRKNGGKERKNGEVFINQYNTNMNNEFCNRIDVFLLQDVQKIKGNEVFLKSAGKEYTFETDDFSLTPKSIKTDAGLLYNIDETITADTLTDEIHSIFRYSRSVIIRIHTRSNTIILGTLQFPARIILTNQLNKIQIQITYSSPTNPF